MLLFALLCLSGCRYRITGTADADTIVDDYDGTRQEQFETQREEIDLEPEPPQVPPQEIQQQSQKTQKNDSTDNSPGKSSDSSNSGKNDKNGKEGKDGKGGKGTGGSGGNGGNGNGGNGGNGNNVDPDNKPSTVTVRFDPNGGSCETKSMKKTTGAAYGDLPSAEREYYTFEGWFTDPDEGDAVYSNTVLTQKKDHTLFAHWRLVDSTTYILTFDPCGGRMKNRDKTRQIQRGQEYGTLPLPVLTGYEFNGWFTAPEGGTLITETDTFAEATDLILYAQWTFDAYRYWSSARQSMYESMYACQVVDCYIEFEDHQTVTSCELLAKAKIGNCARNRGNSTTVTDEWVEERNPKVIVKCTNKNPDTVMSEMHERFPGRRIIVVPEAAAYGDDHERLFYTLCLGAVIYPDWFGTLDINKAGEELEVHGGIYE